MGFKFRQVQDLFLPKNVWGPPNLFLIGYRGIFRGKRSGALINHSPPSSAEVKNEWSYTSRPSICLHGVDREKFIFQ